MRSNRDTRAFFRGPEIPGLARLRAVIGVALTREAPALFVVVPFEGAECDGLIDTPKRRADGAQLELQFRQCVEEGGLRPLRLGDCALRECERRPELCFRPSVRTD